LYAIGSTSRVFQSTPSGGKATRLRFSISSTRSRFNPRLPGGRRHPFYYPVRARVVVSIHAFRGEGDVRRVTASGRPGVSIHAFRGEGDVILVAPHTCESVSIHAFRGEGDTEFKRQNFARRCFNPRLPGGRRLFQVPIRLLCQLFQSTPSGGKATMDYHHHHTTILCFNPRLPGGRRPTGG